MTIHS